MPMPVSATTHQVRSSTCRLQADAPAAVGVLGRVVQQVRQDLRQARGVAVQEHRTVRQVDLQLVAVQVDIGAHHFQRVVDHRFQLDAAHLDRELAGVDARDVQQVVHQAHHLAQLAFHDVGGALGRLGVAAAQAQDVEAGADRRQRIAQLVRQGRQEFVLAAVGHDQRLLGALAHLHLVFQRGGWPAAARASGARSRPACR
jgi:Tfp pilus assembly protein FimT